MGMSGDMPIDHDIDDFFQFDGADADADDDPQAVAGSRPVPPRLGLLAGLDDREFDQVARVAQLKFFERGQTVFTQGDEADRFFILVDGQLEVIRDGQRIATLEAGAFFGESALLLDTQRTASVATLEDSSLWSVDYAVFRDIVSHHLLADERARREVNARLEDTPSQF